MRVVIPDISGRYPLFEKDVTSGLIKIWLVLFDICSVFPLTYEIAASPFMVEYADASMLDGMIESLKKKILDEVSVEFTTIPLNELFCAIVFRFCGADVNTLRDCTIFPQISIVAWGASLLIPNPPGSFGPF